MSHILLLLMFTAPVPALPYSHNALITHSTCRQMRRLVTGIPPMARRSPLGWNASANLFWFSLGTSTYARRREVF
jgi:hypothetical protein